MERPGIWWASYDAWKRAEPTEQEDVCVEVEGTGGAVVSYPLLSVAAAAERATREASQRFRQAAAEVVWCRVWWRDGRHWRLHVRCELVYRAVGLRECPVHDVPESDPAEETESEPSPVFAYV